MSTPAITYVRVSTVQQEADGYSLDAQRALLSSYVKQHDFRIVASFEDAETAKTSGKRPDFARMLAFLETHPAVRVVLCDKTDRFARNLRDALWIEEHGIELHAVREGSIINPASHASQKLFHGLKVLMAKHYSENLSEEIKKGMREKATEGGYPTHAPLGYQNTNADCGITPDPKSAPLVQELFRRASTGEYSGRQLTTLARSVGLRSKRGLVLNKDTILTNILRNPAYTGTFRWAGALYEGKYEPLINRDLFDRVQTIINARRPPRHRTHTYTYTGLIRCGTCGATMSGDLKKGRYVYYNCNGKKNCRKTYAEPAIETHTLALLDHLHIPEAVADWLTTELTATITEQNPTDDARRARLTARLTELERLASAAYEDKLLGRTTNEFWTEQTNAWTEERQRIQAELAAISAPRNTAALLRAAREPLELLKTLPAEYVRRNPEEKRSLLQTLVSNYTITDGTISVAMRSPFDVLRDGLETGDWWS